MCILSLNVMQLAAGCTFIRDYFVGYEALLLALKKTN
jgi:hypothetical protein